MNSHQQAQKKTSLPAASTPVKNQLQSRPFAVLSERRSPNPDLAEAQGYASNLGNYFANLPILAPAPAITDRIQLAKDLTTGAGDELKQKLLKAQQQNNAANAASGWAKVKKVIKQSGQGGMDLMTQYNLSPLAGPARIADMVDNARDKNQILEKSQLAEAQTQQGELAPNPLTGMVHHHYRTVKQLNAAQYQFKEGKPYDLPVTKLIPPNNADQYLKGERTIPAVPESEKPGIGGFYSLAKFSQPLNAPEAVQQFGLGYGWEQNKQTKQWDKAAPWASPYLDKDKSKDPQTKSGLKGVEKIHYLESKMTPELLDATAIPMTKDIHSAVEDRAKAYQDAIASDEIHDRVKWNARRAQEGFEALQVSKRAIAHEGDNPYTGTGSSASGPELETKYKKDRVRTDLITEFKTKSDGRFDKRIALPEAKLKLKGIERGKDATLGEFKPGKDKFEEV